ncbi:MAG: hypothetical protein AAGG50_18405 [Bacteroidota bacterium]
MNAESREGGRLVQPDFKRRYALSRYACALAVALSLGSVGCTGISVVDEPFTFRGFSDTGEALRLDGYYYEENDNRGTPYTHGTTIVSVLLWKDGTAAVSGSMGQSVGDYPGFGPLYFGTLRQAKDEFERYLQGEDMLNKSGAGTFDQDRLNPMGILDWGAYRVEGDSLTLQILRHRPGSWLGLIFDVLEIRGRVLSDTSFVLEESQIFSGPYPREPHRYRAPKVHYFESFEDMPSSGNWTHTYPDLQPKKPD